MQGVANVVQLTEEPIVLDDIYHAVRSRRAGAVVMFLGTVRELTGERWTDSLHYEAYGAMAYQQLEKICRVAGERWPVLECQVVHRLGPLELGEVAVVVAVSTPHRAEAFAAAEWLMDTIKADVPIWKREHYRNGDVEWIHPTPESPGGAS